MARRKTHRKTHRKTRRNKNMILKQGVNVVKSTSKKYMPKLKSGLENVGSKVIKSGQETVPYLQRLTRKMFGSLTKKRR